MRSPRESVPNCHRLRSATPPPLPRFTKMQIQLDHTHADSMNLAVLQRLDPQIECIVASASHVAMYSYSEEKGEWVKRGIEGAIFIVERCVVVEAASARRAARARRSRASPGGGRPSSRERGRPPPMKRGRVASAQRSARARAWPAGSRADCAPPAPTHAPQV